VRTLVFVMLVACGSKPAPQPPLPPQPEQPVEQATPAPPPPPPEPPRRIDYAVGESPTSLVVSGGALVWTDSAGAIWTQPIKGGTPKQLSEQHGIGFTFHPVVVGADVFVSTKRDFVRVTSDGKVTKLGLALPEDPEQVVADEQTIYVTLFKRDDVMAVAPSGSAKKLFKVHRGVLAVDNGSLYAVSYANGNLVVVPTTGGAPRTIAKGFVRPTALAADATHAFIYGEKDRSLRKVVLATGEVSVLATDLDNADDLVSDGDWLYTYSWPNKLLRIAKDGSKTDVLADDLKSPTHIAVDADAIYVVSRDQHRIVRIRK
jgi:hypothetical protein